MTEAQKDSRQRLTQSAEMLVKLLSMNAPPVIVCGQVVQIFNQALMAHGDSLYAELGKSVRQSKLVANGYCPKCERQHEKDGQGLAYPDHCPECRAQLEAEHHDPSRN